MYQKDYILRLTEMIRELIAGILGLIKKGELDVASEQLSRIYYDLLKQDSAFFFSIPEDKLTEKLLHEHNYTNGHLEVLAELFNTDAELQAAQGNISKSIEFSGKSLILFEFLEKEQKTYSQYRLNKIEVIKQRIKTLNS